MIKKFGFMALAAILFVFFTVPPAFSKNDKTPPVKAGKTVEHQNKVKQSHEYREKGDRGGPSGPNGRSFMAKLYFFPENPEPDDLVIIGDDTGDGDDAIDEENDILPIPWGKMSYNLAGPYFKFVFNGHGLTPGTEYALIYYPAPGTEPMAAGDPVANLMCLGSGVCDEYGNVHIANKLYEELCDLPYPEDGNYPKGAQLILAPAGQIDCTAGTETAGWDPATHLFGYTLIVYEDTTCDHAVPVETDGAGTE